MGAMAETAGSLSRAVTLGKALKDSCHEVALCVSHDMNYKKPSGLKEYDLETPVPLGLPAAIGTRTFPIAQRLGITSRKEVRSFEEVLKLTGNSCYCYLCKSVDDIRTAARDFEADIIYSEFSISAIIAAKLMGIRCFATVSFPTQSEFACTPSLSKDVNRYLRENGLPEVRSTLDLFKTPEKKFVPSIRELEPFEDGQVIYCGSWKTVNAIIPSKSRNKILVYMGNCTISSKVMVKEVSEAFRGSQYEVYIAGKDLSESNDGNINTAPFFDFSKLLNESVLFINHGGQNSIVDGLVYSVPMLICPGKVFERKYNAESVVRCNAGSVIDHNSFNSSEIKEKALTIIGDSSFAESSSALGTKLTELKGAATVAEFI